MTFDDSALFHARAPYDPAAARAYYLRTRKLKGRRPVRIVAPKGNGKPHAVPVNVKKPSSQAELKAKRDALERRFDDLRVILARKVKAAKSRSGIEDPTKSSPKKDAAKTQSNKNDTSLSATEKRKKADDAREKYKKEQGGTSVSQEIQTLQKQIADIRARIDAAIKDAQTKQKSTHQTASKGR